MLFEGRIETTLQSFFSKSGFDTLYAVASSYSTTGAHYFNNKYPKIATTPSRTERA
jgi:hypothetical protein